MQLQILSLELFKLAIIMTILKYIITCIRFGMLKRPIIGMVY